MKLRLNLSLRAALMACYAMAAPVATTLFTGALIVAPQALATDTDEDEEEEDEITLASEESSDAAAIVAAEEEVSYDIGNVMYVGDSITHGGSCQSYRYNIHTIFVDNGLTYNSIGIMEGDWSVEQSPTSYGGVTYTNIHNSESGGNSSAVAGTADDSRDKFGDSNITNWMGQSSTTADGTDYVLGASMPCTSPANIDATLKVFSDDYVAADGVSSEYVEGSPDVFWMMIGTNDVNDDWNAWNGTQDITDLTCVANLYTNMQTIYDSVRENSADCKIILGTIPVWSAAKSWSSVNDAGRQAIYAYNQSLYDWAGSLNDENIIIVDTSVGMVDVTLGIENYKGLASMFYDGLHPNDQGNLIFAANFAKGSGYAGGTAGQARKAQSEFTVNFSSGGSTNFVDAENVQSKGITMSNTTVTADSIKLGGNGQSSSLYYAWQDGEGLSNGATVDFNLVLGDGATNGWNTADDLSIIMGNDSYSGTLCIDEGYVSWDGSILYSLDTSTNEYNFRLAWVNGQASAEIASGFYLWLDDMLIGAGLQGTSGSYTDFDGVTFTYDGEGNVILKELSIDGTASYAPTTDGLSNADGVYIATADNPDGPSATDVSWNADGTVVWTTQEFDADHTGSTTATGADFFARSNATPDALGGAVSLSIDADDGAADRIYVNSSSYSGDVWAEINSGAINNASVAWIAAHGYSSSVTGGSFVVDGSIFLKFTGDVTGSLVNAEGSLTGNGATVLGATNGGIVNGSIYLEFSADNLHLGNGYSSIGASVAGAYLSNIAQDMHMVFNAGTFGSAIYGGVVNGTSNYIGGMTYIDVNGGTFNGNIYGGGKVGAQGGNLLVSSSTTAIDLSIAGGTINASVYGGGTGGTITGNTNVSITAGTITGDVYGGGSGGTINGSTSVTIDGNDVVLYDGTNWGNVNAGGGSTISGSQTLTIKNVSDSENTYGFDKFAGNLTSSNAANSQISFENVQLSNFAANISNFSTMYIGANSQLTLTNAAEVSVGNLVLDSNLSLTIAEASSFTMSNLGSVFVSFESCSIVNHGVFNFTDATVINPVDFGSLISGDGTINLAGAWDVAALSVGGVALADFDENSLVFQAGLSLSLGQGLEDGKYALFGAADVSGLDNIVLEGLLDNQKYSWSFDNGILSLTLAMIEDIAWNGASTGGNWSDASWSYNGTDNTSYTNLDNIIFTDKGEAVSINLDVNASANDMTVTRENNWTITGEKNFTVADDFALLCGATMTFDVLAVSMNAVSITGGSLVMGVGTSFSANSISMSNANLTLGETSSELNAALALSGQNSISLAADSASLLLNSAITYDTAWTAAGTNTLSIVGASSVSLGSDFSIDVSAGFTVSEAGSYTILSILSRVGDMDISNLDTSNITGIDTTTANNYIFSWALSDGNLNLVATASDVLYYNPWKGTFYDIDLGEATSTDNTRTATTNIEGARLVINNSAGNSGATASLTGKAYSIDICNTSNTSISSDVTLSSYTTITKTEAGTFYLGGTLQADEGIFIKAGSIIYGNYNDENTSTYQQEASIISDVNIYSGATLNVGNATYVANGDTALIDMVGETGSLTYNSLSNATVSNATITISGATTYTGVTVDCSSTVSVSSALTLAGTTSLSNVTLNSGTSLTTAANANATINGSALSYSSATSNTQLRYDLSITLGADSTLSQNTQYWLASSSSSVDMEVIINGSGTYELTSMLMRYTDTGDVTLNINDDATMHITNTKTTSSTSNTSGAYSGFVTSGASGTYGESIVNVSGTLELDSGIVSYSSGNGTINVLTVGDLVLNRGTLSYSNGGSITIDVEGGTVQLGNTVNDSYTAASASDDLSALTMNLYNGASIYGTGETFSSTGFTTTTTTDIYQALTLAESGTINIGTASSSTVNLYTALDQGDYAVILNVSGGTLNLAAGATLTSITAATGSTLNISSDVTAGTLSVDALNVTAGSLAVSASAGVSALTVSGGTASFNGTLTADSVTLSSGTLNLAGGATIGALTAETGTTLNITSEVSLGSLTAGALSITDSSASLSVSLSVSGTTSLSSLSMSAGTVNFNGDATTGSLSLTNSTLNVGDNATLFVTGNASFSGATVTGDLDVTGSVAVTSGASFKGDVQSDGALSFTGTLSFNGGQSEFTYMTISSSNNSVLNLTNGAEFSLTADSAYTYEKHLTVNLSGGSSFETNTTTRIQGGSDWYFNGDSTTKTGGTVLFDDGLVISQNGTSGTTLTLGQYVCMTVNETLTIGASSGTNAELIVNGDLISNAVLSNTGSASATVSVNSTGSLTLNQGLTASVKTGLNLNVSGSLIVSTGSAVASVDSFNVTMGDGSKLIGNDSSGTTTVYQAISYADDATVTFDGGTYTDASSAETVAALLVVNSNVSGTNVSAKIDGNVSFAGGASLNAIELAENATLGLGGTVSVTDSITLNSGASIDLSDITSLTLGGLVLDYTLEYGTDYTIFTGASSSISTDIMDITNISSTGVDSTLFKYSWSYDDKGNISLSLSAIESAPTWDETTGETTIPEDSTSGKDFVFNTDESGAGDSAESSATINTGSTGTEEVAGTTETGNVVITGDTDVSIAGDNALESSGSITVGSADDSAAGTTGTSTNVTVSTTVSAEDGFDVVNGSLTVDEKGTLADTKVTLAEDTTLSAGNITVTGTGADSSVDGTVAYDALSADVTKSSVEVSGDATLSEASICSDSTLSVTDGTLTLESGSTIAADTTLAEGTAVSTGVITITGKTDEAGYSFSDGGSLTDTDLSTATVEQSHVEVTGVATLTNSTIEADSVLEVSSGSLTVDESLVIEAKGTDDGSSATITIGSEGSVSSTAISDASVSGAVLTIKGATSGAAAVAEPYSFSMVRTVAATTYDVATIDEEVSAGSTLDMSGSDLSDTTVVMEEGSTLNLTDVIISSDTIFEADSDTTVNAKNLTIYAATGDNLSISDEDGLTYSINTFSSVETVNLSGAFNVDLTLDANQYADLIAALDDGESVSFDLTGVSGIDEMSSATIKIAALDEALEIAESITLNGIDASSYDSGNLVFSVTSADVIPEPSTSALSLLALAGLLARRRRKA